MVSPGGQPRGPRPLNGIFPHGNAGLIGTHGFFLQSGHGYDVGVMALFLFQVVFMETAGYIIIGAIAERISFAGFLLAEVAMGAHHLPDLRQLGVGRRVAGPARHLEHLGPWRRRLRRLRSRARHRGWTALALAILLGPRIGKFNKDGTPNAIPGHNLGYVVIGTLILVFGWMGFNPGSTLRCHRPAHLASSPSTPCSRRASAS